MIDRKYPIPNDPRLKGILEAIYNAIDELQARPIELALSPSAQNALAQQAANQAAGLLGAFGQGVLGQSGVDPLVTPVGTGSGTVVSVTAGGGLSGGTFSVSGTIVLLIGTANVLQKSNGTRLVDSLAGDDGTTVSIAIAAGKKTVIGGGDTSGMSADGSTSLLGDWLSVGNGTYLEIVDGIKGIYILHNLPTSDPLVPGALWTDGAGGMFISL